jgi:hypothetical protein
MNLRSIETALAWFTFAALSVYAPVETWTSLPHGLLSPFYLVDVIAMMLLFVGAVRSLRARPDPAPGLLCAGCAWTAANGWRATFDRVYEVSRGGVLPYGMAEVWAVGLATAVAIGCLMVAMLLVVQAERGKK